MTFFRKVVGEDSSVRSPLVSWPFRMGSDVASQLRR